MGTSSHYWLTGSILNKKTPSIQNKKTPSARNQIASILAASASSLVFLTGVVGASDVPQGRAVNIEIAPNELGDYRADSELILAASSSNEEVIVLNKDRLEISRFLESGKPFGRSFVLQFSGLAPFPSVSRLDSLHNRLAISGDAGVYLFSNQGSLRSSRRLFQPADVAIVSANAVAVSLVNIPHPAKPGQFLARKEFAEAVPRIITLDKELGTSDTGLPIEGLDSEASSIVGSSLRLATGGGRLFAAEMSNYRIYELDDRLRPIAIFSDPDRVESSGEAAAPVEPEAPEDEDSSKNQIFAGQDLGRSNSGAKGKRISLRYRSVMRDIAWDKATKRLIILTDLTDSEYLLGIDCLNPTTGVLKRTKIKLPAGTNQGTRLSQLGVGLDYVWLRAFNGQSPTFRLPKSILDSGDEIPLSGGSLLAEEESVGASLDL